MKKTLIILIGIIALVIAANLVKNPIINIIGKIAVGIIVLTFILCIISIIKAKINKK